LRGALRVIWRDRPLRLAVLGIAVYWGSASLLGQDMLVYGKAVLGLSDESAAVPLGACGRGREELDVGIIRALEIVAHQTNAIIGTIGCWTGGASTLRS